MIWLGPIANLPTTYACGSTFTIRNSISYKKGEFINIFHDNVTAKPLSEICHDVQVKPSLLPLTEERRNIVPLLKPTKQGWTFEQDNSGYEDSKHF